MQIIIQCQKETRELADDRRSTRLSGRKYDKTLQEFAKYLRKLLEGKTAQDIARDTGYPYSKAETAFNKSYIPTCDLMKRLIEVYDNGNYETLRELSNNNIKLLYEYWSLIYPTAEPLDRLGFVIRSIVMEKKLDRATVVKNVGITQPRYSNVINGKCVITYNLFMSFANAMDTPPADILMRLNNREGEEDRKRFSDIIKEERKKRGLSIEQASMACNASIKQYESAENASASITKALLKNMVTLYELDYAKIAQIAVAGKLIEADKLRRDKLTIYDSRRLVGRKIVSEGNLADFVRDIAKYDYIKNNDEYIPAHTVCTTVLLFLLDAGTWRNILEELHYLSQPQLESLPDKKDDNIIAANFLDNSLKSNWRDYKFVFDFYRNRAGLSYNEIVKLSCCKNRKNVADALSDTGMFKSLVELYSCLNIYNCPVSYGIEHFLTARSEEKDSVDFIELSEIFFQIDCSLTWEFYGNIIDKDIIKKLFYILYERKGRGVKLSSIVEMDIPKSPALHSLEQLIQNRPNYTLWNS